MLFERLVSLLQDTDRQNVHSLQNPGRILLDSSLSLSQKSQEVSTLFVLRHCMLDGLL